MNLSRFWSTNRTVLIILAVLLVLGILGFTGMGTEPFIRTTLSGLTLGMLYFLVAAGLTLIFGLMGVLNFAHGAMFMIGAYAGWQFYTNPTFLFGIAPLVLAFLMGLMARSLIHSRISRMIIPEGWQDPIQKGLVALALIVGVAAIWGLDILGLADTAVVAITVTSNPLDELSAQELLSSFWIRPILLALSGLLLAAANSRPGDKTQTVHPVKSWKEVLPLIILAALTLITTLMREPGSRAALTMDSNIRFVLSLVVGTLVGAGLGMAVEAVLIRPLYARHFYQVLVTLGLAYVLREMIQLLWQPLAYQMSRPPWFSQPGKAETIWAWFTGHQTTVDIWGVTFPTYRLFIILLGVVMVVALAALMKYSRLGMIIRAGVQDREMVEALGINVRRVFMTVFALGAGLAALGGIGASPFIPVEPNMGDKFQLQAFIVVVIGGMGSFSGAAVGAILLGMARAFGDYLALKAQLSPAIAEASTVIIMILVLLVKPSGLLGRKE